MPPNSLLGSATGRLDVVVERDVRPR